MQFNYNCLIIKLLLLTLNFIINLINYIFWFSMIYLEVLVAGSSRLKFMSDFAYIIISLHKKFHILIFKISKLHKYSVYNNLKHNSFVKNNSLVCHYSGSLYIGRAWSYGPKIITEFSPSIYLYSIQFLRP